MKNLIEKIDIDVETKKNYWNILEEYTNEFDEIIGEEFAVYRRRPYILTDFFNKWQNNIKLEKSNVNLRILQQIEKYQNILPILQVLQSDSLTDKHWANIFVSLKKVPKPFHEILLKDIIKSTDDLTQTAANIQVSLCVVQLIMYRINLRFL